MEEKELVRLSKEGDDEAFAALVKKYKMKVFNLAYSLTRDAEMADDLAQEAFIKAYFALPKFKFRSEFGTWLYRITVNHARDYLRKKSRMNKMLYEGFKENILVQENEWEKKEHAQIEAQRKKLVHQCLQVLPENYQVIITLRDIQGFSYEKISEILNISPGTVDSRIHRARKMLRKKISPLLSQKGGSHEM
jgi:RNA polymerase sigma-70 factor (ECF subfamily)